MKELEKLKEKPGRELEWKELASVMVNFAKELCDREQKGVANPWTIGKEKGIEKIQKIRRVNRNNERKY